MFATPLAAAAIRGGLITLLAGAAFFLTVLAALLAAAACSGRLVCSVALAGLCVLARAAGWLIFSCAACRLFRVTSGHCVMRAARMSFRIRRCSFIATGTCFGLGGSRALLGSGRCVWSCGLSPRQYGEGQNKSDKFSFHFSISIRNLVRNFVAGSPRRQAFDTNVRRCAQLM